MKKWLLFYLIVSSITVAMEKELFDVRPYSITVKHHSKEEHSECHDSQEYEEIIEYVLGRSSPVVNKELIPRLKKRVADDPEKKKEITEVVVDALERTHLMTEINKATELMRTIREHIGDSVNEALSEKDTQIEAQIQIARLKEKELRMERYKFLAALMGCIGTSASAVVTLIVLFSTVCDQ